MKNLNVRNILASILVQFLTMGCQTSREFEAARTDAMATRSVRSSRRSSRSTFHSKSNSISTINMPELPGSPVPGTELLHQACRQGNVEVLARFLARDAYHDISDDFIGDLMVTAIRHKQPVLLEYLLSRYSGPLDRYPPWLGYVHTAIFEVQAGLDMYKILAARWPDLPVNAKMGTTSDGKPPSMSSISERPGLCEAPDRSWCQCSRSKCFLHRRGSCNMNVPFSTFTDFRTGAALHQTPERRQGRNSRGEQAAPFDPSRTGSA